MNTAETTLLVERARSVAADLLGDDEDRWQHSAGVAECAASLTAILPAEDGEVLIAAAWLHDIGYSPILAETGLHSLDGAAYLDRKGWPRRITGLVAHHSGSRFLASARGMDDPLSRYPDERSLVSDALTYADQRVGPYGQPMSIQTRLADKFTRHGPTSTQAQVRGERDPYLLAVGERIERRLHDTGHSSWH